MSVSRRFSIAALVACLVVLVAASTASATLRSPRLIDTCPSGSTYQEKTRGPFRLEGCLVTEADRYITAGGTSVAELNGIDVSLLQINRSTRTRISLSRTGSTRVFTTTTTSATNSSGRVELRLKAGTINVPVFRGPLNLTAPGTAAPAASPAGGNSFDFDLDLGQLTETAKLLGLELEGDGPDGEIHFSLTSSRVDIDANLKFPEILGGAQFAADFSVIDGQGLQLDELELNSGDSTLPFDDVPGAFVKDLLFRFEAPDTVTIGGKVVLPMIVPQSFAGELTFNSQGLQRIFGEISGLNLPIDPATGIFFLQGGNVEVGVNPLTFGGAVILSAGPVEETSGAHIVKFTGGFQFQNSTPSKLKLFGTTSMLGLGDLNALTGNQSITYSSDNVLSLDQTSELDLTVAGVGGLKATTTIGGSFSDDGFRVSGAANGNFSAFGVSLASAGGSFKANGTGYGVCLTGNFLGANVTGQARADWGDDPALGLGCNLARFQNRSLSRAVAAGAVRGSAFAIPRGATNAAVRVIGGSGPPSFDLRLADGTVLQVRDPKSEATVVGGRAVHRADGPNSTIVYVGQPPAGNWTVSEIAGQPLSEVQSAHDAPPSAEVKVSGRGERRLLSWETGELEGGRLQLHDVQGDGTSTVLLDTARQKGRRRFKIPFGRAGRRRIIAIITGIDGIPRAELLAGQYRAPRPFVPGPPRDVKARFNPRKQTLTFSQVPPTNPDKRPDYWYYRVELDDGRVLYLQGSNSQKVNVPDVANGTDFEVSVFGIEEEGLQGRARTERGES